MYIRFIGYTYLKSKCNHVNWLLTKSPIAPTGNPRTIPDRLRLPMWKLSNTPVVQSPKVPIAKVPSPKVPIAIVPQSLNQRIFVTPQQIASGTIANPSIAVQRIVSGNRQINALANSLGTGFSRDATGAIVLPQGIDTSLGLTLSGVGETGTLRTNKLPIARSQFEALWSLPVVGSFSYELGIEQHPSGSLQLACRAIDIAQVRSALKVGTELELLGIGFVVSSYKESLDQSQIYSIAVSLSGKWSAERYNKQSFLRGAGIRGAAIGGSPQLDSACTVSSGSTIGNTAKVGTAIAIADLADQVGVKFIPLTNGTGGWSVFVPIDADQYAAQLWSSDIQQRSRPNGGFIDWNDPAAVRVRAIDSGGAYFFPVKAIEVDQSGDASNSPNHYGYAIEYKNTELSGITANSIGGAGAGNQNQLPVPQWIPHEGAKVTLRSGDKNPDQPPDNAKTLRDLSHNFDASGATKTLRISTTQDGQPIEVEEFIYGFLYTANQIFSQSSGELFAPAIGYWQLCSYKKQTFIYDAKYGFSLGYNTDGFRWARVKQESDGYETIVDPTDTAAQTEADLYRFVKIPVIERSRLSHHAYATYYPDTQEQPGWVSYKHCNRDGTSSTYYVQDPTWSPAMFAHDEISYAVSFFKKLNPEYDGTAGYDFTNPPPPRWLLSGEESLNRKEITPIAATKDFAGANSAALAKRLGFVDQYVERSVEDSAQNASFKDKAIRETFAESEGRPSPSSRKPSRLDRVNPNQTNAPANGSSSGAIGVLPQNLRYSVTTPGWTVADPVDGSIGFPNATSPDTALAGAIADLKIKDVQQSVKVSCQIPFSLNLRPMDLIEIAIDTERLRVRAATISNTVMIHGVVDGARLFTWDPTKLSAGLDRVIPVSMSVVAKTPAASIGRSNPDDNSAPRTISPYGLVIEDQSPEQVMAGFAAIESRGNF